MIERETAPDPIEDPLGYDLWCEAHACPNCEGVGSVNDDDDDGERPCYLCDGIGIDPCACDDGADDDFDNFDDAEDDDE